MRKRRSIILYTAPAVISAFAFAEHERKREREKSYPQKLPPIQHNPSVQPAAVSPRSERQEKTRAGVNGFPTVRAVKRIRVVVQR